jgi:tetratricopeptide (TPR) repeat protein/tRNA A-37 threonylcarbamoyl transferase component Bud32
MSEEMPMPPRQVDCNLLFGFLALQKELISSEEFHDTASAWLAQKTRSLEEILRERSALNDRDCEAISRLAQQHLQGATQEAKPTSGDSPTIDYIPNWNGKPNDSELTTSFVDPVNNQSASSAHTNRFPIQSLHPDASRFQILRPHARGGLGQVYVARDAELNREVALKEIQLQYADESESRNRFLLEAEITGGLEHPGVVPVYGFGQYSDGRPYYAMRFIRGESMRTAIEEFHAQHSGREAFSSVAFRNLINRFIAVCNAMEYAHSRGVLHRDIKPANIMLGPYGETLVVDWGLARARGREEHFRGSQENTLRPRSSSGTAHTQAGSAIGTPAFMSPEQAAGRLDDLGPSADIYSLGATLYSLLTNDLPIPKGSTVEVLRRVQQGEFPAPRKKNPLIPKPLEGICLKSMALETQDRYPSAMFLAQDLERWLADEPVSAYRETRFEQARRWARRHRTVVQAVAISIVLIAFVATVAAIWVNSARAHEAAAKSEAQRMYLVAQGYLDRWLPGISEVLQYAPGGRPIRERMLVAAADDYQRLAQHPAAEPRMEFERGRTLLRLGDVRRELGKSSDAAEAFAQAEELFEDLGRTHPDLANPARVELGRTQLRRGALLAENDDPTALEFWRGTVNLLDPVVFADDLELDRRLVLAAARVSIAEWLEREGQANTAQREVEAAIGLLQKHGAGDQGQRSTKDEALLAANLTALRLQARIQQTQNNFVAARETLSSALGVDQSINDGDAVGPGKLMATAELQIELGSVLRTLGLVEEELDGYSEALSTYRKLLAMIPDSPTYREAMILTLLDRAQLFLECSRLAEAARDLQEALPLAKALSVEHPGVARFQQELAACLEASGRLAHGQGHDRDARELLQESVRIFEELANHQSEFSEYLERAAVARGQLARSLAALGESSQANAEFDKALVAIRDLHELAPEHSRLTTNLAWLLVVRGGWRFDCGEQGTAQLEFRQAIDVWTKTTAKWPTLANARAFAELLANCPVSEFRDPQRAIQLVRPFLDSAPKDDLGRIALGWALCRVGKPEEALALLEGHSTGNQPLAAERLVRALALHTTGQIVEGQNSFDEAMAIASKSPGDESLRRLAKETAQSLGIRLPDAGAIDP